MGLVKRWDVEEKKKVSDGLNEILHGTLRENRWRNEKKKGKQRSGDCVEEGHPFWCGMALSDLYRAKRR